MLQAKEIQTDEVSKIWQLKAQEKHVSEILVMINRAKKSIEFYHVIVNIKGNVDLGGRV